MNTQCHNEYARGASSSPQSHPFLVDQSPYFKWDSRSTGSPGSLSSKSSSSSRSHRSSSTCSTASSSSVALDRSWPFPSTSTPLGPPAFIRPPPPPPRRASASSANSPPPTASQSTAQRQRQRFFSTPETHSPRTPPPVSDTRCAQFMKDAEQQEYYFGSVAARVSPRAGVRRELLPQLETGVEVLEVLKPLPPLPTEAFR